MIMLYHNLYALNEVLKELFLHTVISATDSSVYILINKENM